MGKLCGTVNKKRVKEACSKIKKITSQLKEFFEMKKDIIAVYLYGPYGKNKATKKSAIDLAILLKPPCSTRSTTDQEINLATKIQK